MSDRARNSTLPRRREPMRRRSAKTRARDAAERPYKAHVKGYGCLLAWRGECWGPIDPAHVVKRSRLAPLEGNCVPLCRKHHDEQEGQNPQFEARYNVDLKDIAATIAADWLDRTHDNR